MGEENNCKHDFAYLDNEGESSVPLKGCCVRCNKLVELTKEYALYSDLLYKKGEDLIPVYMKQVLDQHYSALTRMGTDFEKLIDFLQRNYGNVQGNGKETPLLDIWCTSQNAERLNADYKNKDKLPPLNSILVLTKHEQKKKQD